MIEPQDIRVGNIALLDDSKFVRVLWFRLENACIMELGVVYPSAIVGLDRLKPVELSEEWFLYFGLDHDGRLHSADSETKEKSIQDIGIRYVSYFYNNRLEKWMDCQTRITFDYVHEVQNHYKVMTKKELFIEPGNWKVK